MAEVEKLKFEWPDTGKLEIEIKNNLSAVLRFEPSPYIVAETLAKFAKNAANQELSQSHKTTHKNENKPP